MVLRRTQPTQNTQPCPLPPKTKPRALGGTERGRHPRPRLHLRGSRVSGPGSARAEGRRGPALRGEKRLLLTPPQPAPPREAAPDPAAMLGRDKWLGLGADGARGGTARNPRRRASAPEGGGARAGGGRGASSGERAGGAQVAAAPAPPPRPPPPGSGGAEPGEGAGAARREVESEAEGWGSPGIPSSWSSEFGAGRAVVAAARRPGRGGGGGRGPAGLASARRPLPATPPRRRPRGSCERGWRAGKDPAGPRARTRPTPARAALGPGARPPSRARRRRHSRPRRLGVGKLGRNFSPRARLARRACLLPGATCSPPDSVSAPSSPARSRPGPT